MHIHILGICGTFMGSLAILARSMGYRVTGSDANVYPPMSTQLESQGIEIISGYDPAQLDLAPDLVVVGNAMSRGNPAVEYMLDKGLKYTSGPQWLCEHVLQGRWVLAASGTHGKTTTASMLAWILEYAGMAPGYLIGGVPSNFEVSARLGDTPFFVIEADEYDSAFFDKRSKFVHYRPRTLIINNLEFDHADIFDNLAAIQKQFHHLVRTVPGEGQIIAPADVAAIDQVLEQGCWSDLQRTHGQGDWQVELVAEDGSAFEVIHQGQRLGQVNWSLNGWHNVNNGLVALIAARHVGVSIEHGIAALAEFAGVKRRMERFAEADGIVLYDDFAHHPTAIETTLQGLRAKVGDEPIIALIEPRSNTMRLGEHRAKLAGCAALADRTLWFQPEGLDWSLDEVVAGHQAMQVVSSHQHVLDIVTQLQGPAHLVVMSNGGFGGIHDKLKQLLESR